MYNVNVPTRFDPHEAAPRPQERPGARPPAPFEGRADPLYDNICYNQLHYNNVCYICTCISNNNRETHITTKQHAESNIAQ